MKSYDAFYNNTRYTVQATDLEAARATARLAVMGKQKKHLLVERQLSVTLA